MIIMLHHIQLPCINAIELQYNLSSREWIWVNHNWNNGKTCKK